MWNPALRSLIEDRLLEIEGWRSPSEANIYFVEYIDLFFDDLPTEIDPDALIGWVLHATELVSFLDFTRLLGAVRQSLGDHDIFSSRPLPSGLDLTSLRSAASALRVRMLASD